MAITNQNSGLADIQKGVTRSNKNFYATEHNGDIQMSYFEHVQSGVGDAGSDVLAVVLPPGRVRVLGDLSSVYVNWTGGSAVLDVGHKGYTGADGVAVASDVGLLDDGVSVESAGKVPLCSEQDDGTYLFESKDGVELYMTAPVALADGDEIKGYVAYVST